MNFINVYLWLVYIDLIIYQVARICVPHKTGDVNLNVFNMIKEISESKTLTKNIHVIVNYFM